MNISVIKKLLKGKGMTFQQLSDKMGVDRTNLYNSLTKGNPTLGRLEAISDILGVPVWRLFTETEKTGDEIFGIIVFSNKTYLIDSISAYKALLKKIEEQ